MIQTVDSEKLATKLDAAWSFQIMQGVAIGLVVKEALLGIVWRYLTDEGLYGEEHSVGEFGFLKTNIFGETSYFSEL